MSVGLDRGHGGPDRVEGVLCLSGAKVEASKAIKHGQLSLM